MQTAMSSDPVNANPRMSRTEVTSRVGALLDGAGADWAWQGDAGAVAAWEGATGPKDLDIWCRSATGWEDLVRHITDGLPGALVSLADDPRRLRHASWAVEVADGLAVVDVTFGDLRVGPVLICPEGEVQVTRDVDGPRLAGIGGAADLLVRPLLRGRIPEPGRIESARRAWWDATDTERRWAERLWRRELGATADGIGATLAGAVPPPSLAKQARRQLLRRTLAPRNAGAAWRQRASIVPAGRGAGPLGQRSRGVVLALVGTDGSGKSTVADQTRARLETDGFTTRGAYFGMARGNLPGVALARKLLGIPETVPVDTDTVETPPAADPAPKVDGGLERPMLRRLAAYFYAAEYAWRYASTVALPRRRGEVVVCDRYVYDLRDSPWPGSPAARLAQALIPAPDILALPDAPIEEIHARKPERTLAAQAAQQSAFHALLGERPARYAEVVVDTSGGSADSVGPLVRLVIEAAHRPRRRR